jgi:putative polyketide hydroxylase
MPGRSCPVLIVGAGVGGVAASTLPAHQGVHSLLVEKRREVFVCPTACNLTFRSLEILRRLGPGPSTRSPTTSLPSAEGLSPEVFGKYCPQSKLEPMLLAETRRLGSEVRYGVKLESFNHDDIGRDGNGPRP